MRPVRTCFSSFLWFVVFCLSKSDNDLLYLWKCDLICPSHITAYLSSSIFYPCIFPTFPLPWKQGHAKMQVSFSKRFTFYVSLCNNYLSCTYIHVYILLFVNISIYKHLVVVVCFAELLLLVFCSGDEMHANSNKIILFNLLSNRFYSRQNSILLQVYPTPLAQ